MMPASKLEVASRTKANQSLTLTSPSAMDYAAFGFVYLPDDFIIFNRLLCPVTTV